MNELSIDLTSAIIHYRRCSTYMAHSNNLRVKDEAKTPFGDGFELKSAVPIRLNSIRGRKHLVKRNVVLLH